MNYKPLNFQQKFGLFTEHWQPKVIAEMNDYQFKVVKVQGDFIWYDHRDTDETFIVVEGDPDRFSGWCGLCHNGRDVRSPQGRKAQALRGKEVKVLLIEPRGGAEYRARGWSSDGRER